MRSEVWFRVGGVCAMLGGASWVAKSGSILLSGIQPPFLFEVAPVLFAFGPVGLHARLSGGGGIPAGIGLTLAILGGGLAVVALVSNAPTSSEDFSPVIFGAFLTNFAALVFLGIATRRTGAFPAAWRSLPLAMGLLTFPLIAVGGVLESISKRLLELPPLVIAIAWTWTGYLILASPVTVPRNSLIPVPGDGEGARF